MNGHIKRIKFILLSSVILFLLSYAVSTSQTRQSMAIAEFRALYAGLAVIDPQFRDLFFVSECQQIDPIPAIEDPDCLPAGATMADRIAAGYDTATFAGVEGMFDTRSGRRVPYEFYGGRDLLSDREVREAMPNWVPGLPPQDPHVQSTFARIQALFWQHDGKYLSDLEAGDVIFHAAGDIGQDEGRLRIEAYRGRILFGATSDATLDETWRFVLRDVGDMASMEWKQNGAERLMDAGDARNRLLQLALPYFAPSEDPHKDLLRFVRLESNPSIRVPIVGLDLPLATAILVLTVLCLWLATSATHSIISLQAFPAMPDREPWIPLGSSDSLVGFYACIRAGIEVLGGLVTVVMLFLPAASVALLLVTFEPDRLSIQPVWLILALLWLIAAGGISVLGFVRAAIAPIHRIFGKASGTWIT